MLLTLVHPRRNGGMRLELVQAKLYSYDNSFCRWVIAFMTCTIE